MDKRKILMYKNDERTKFIIETETKAIIEALDNLNDRHIYIGGSVYDLLEIEEEEEDEEEEIYEYITEYIQNKIIENVKKHSVFSEFNEIFNK